MDLASIYSTTTGIALDRPVVYETFYPIEFTDYIIIHPSSGNPCKNYDYWQEVINFLLEINGNLKFVQLGGPEDVPLNRCLNLNGKTTIAQTAYLIKRAKLVIGNDSMLVHMAGTLNIPVVAVYGPTSSANHGPHWKTDDSILIDSHRDGKNPSFGFNEIPKTVNFIKPEEIVYAVTEILRIPISTKIESIFFGPRFNDRIIEVVPDGLVSNEFLPNAILNLRADYAFEPNNIYGQIQMRKCSIYTDKALDVNILAQISQNLTSVIYDITDHDDPLFIRNLIKAGIPVIMISKLSEEELNKKKIQYFDLGIIQKIETFTKDKIKLSDKITPSTLFKTNKLMLSNGRYYASNLHRLMEIPLENADSPIATVLDYPKFYEEAEFFYLFSEND